MLKKARWEVRLGKELFNILVRRGLRGGVYYAYFLDELVKLVPNRYSYKQLILINLIN